MKKYLIIDAVEDECSDTFKDLKICSYEDSKTQIPDGAIFKRPYNRILSEIKNSDAEYYIATETITGDGNMIDGFPRGLAIEHKILSCEDINERLKKAFD